MQLHGAFQGQIFKIMWNFTFANSSTIVDFLYQVGVHMDDADNIGADPVMKDLVADINI